ncbi:4Fe-4S ferredoxin iron-sulfur binding domain protein [Dehalogenimonas lykanthroporepellens BL-DC-9]|nr:4Fe-4S ferredoxin iron-sulfur binding domain protein [Dehalogenimonas lykanthroporepellens BL-DC-9]
MRKKIYIRKEVCIGCGLCRVYCATQHSDSKDIIKAHRKESPKAVPRLKVERQNETSFSVPCRHCDEPWCVYSCLTGAMSKDPVTGVVTSDPDKCIGCWTCVVSCPNGALVKDKLTKVIRKCDLCPDLDVPACVANCPNEAIVLVTEESTEAVEKK